MMDDRRQTSACSGMMGRQVMMMSDTLNIYVRETKTERRALTREEYLALCIYLRNEKNSPGRDVSIMVLKDIVYTSIEIIHNDPAMYGNAEFRTEKMRRAYVDEIEAWHTMGIGYHIGKGFAAWNLLVDESRVILKDKEIILEVVKGD